VRVRKGSPVVTPRRMTRKTCLREYEVDDTDLPLKQIYQCNEKDLTKLCIRDLEAGETNGRMLSVKLARGRKQARSSLNL